MKKNYICPELEKFCVMTSDILLASGDEKSDDTLIDVRALFG